MPFLELELLIQMHIDQLERFLLIQHHRLMRFKIELAFVETVT
jgi:hypothetical protein